MTQREKLPDRRRSETLEFKAGTEPGRERDYVATLGFYPDGRLGEIFLRSGRSGTDISVLMIEIAVATSCALQHGCPAETIRKACPRSAEGRPESVLGTLLDILAEQQKAEAAE